MAALVRPPSYLSCRSPEDHRAGRGVGDGWWVVGRVAIVVATSLPPPTESTTDATSPILPYLTQVLSEAIRRRHLRLSVSAGHSGDGGGGGGAVPRGGRGGWGSFWGMCGGVETLDPPHVSFLP